MCELERLVHLAIASGVFLKAEFLNDFLLAVAMLATPKTSYMRKDSHPLKDRVICGECGMPLKRVTRRGHKTWVCKGRHSGSGCKCAIIKEEILEKKLEEGGCNKITVYEDGRIKVEK